VKIMICENQVKIQLKLQIKLPFSSEITNKVNFQVKFKKSKVISLEIYNIN
jgi:hypothetical protein